MKKLLISALLISSSVQAGELKDLAEAIYFEARSEPIACQIIVAQTIMNRVYQERFKDTVGGVVHQKTWVPSLNKDVCQFSYYCDGKPDTMLDSNAEITSYQIASMVLNDDIIDMSEGADHYYAHNIVKASWSNKLTNKFTCNNHTFGQLKW